jgi:hypothetical protein
MTSQVMGLVLLSLLNISLAGSKVPASLKTTIYEAVSFRYHIHKIHTQRSTSLLKLLSYLHILAYSCVWHL